MVFNSRQTLAASTAIASIASAALLTMVGLCIPYTERALNGQGAAPQAKMSEDMRTAPPQRQGLGTRANRARTIDPGADRGDAQH